MSSVRSAASDAHRAMPTQARGLLDRPSMLGAAGPDSQHCHRPKRSLAHTHHSSYRAASPTDSPWLTTPTTRPMIPLREKG